MHPLIASPMIAAWFVLLAVCNWKTCAVQTQRLWTTGIVLTSLPIVSRLLTSASAHLSSMIQADVEGNGIFARHPVIMTTVCLLVLISSLAATTGLLAVTYYALAKWNAATPCTVAEQSVSLKTTCVVFLVVAALVVAVVSAGPPRAVSAVDYRIAGPDGEWNPRVYGVGLESHAVVLATIRFAMECLNASPVYRYIWYLLELSLVLTFNLLIWLLVQEGLLLALPSRVIFKAIMLMALFILLALPSGASIPIVWSVFCWSLLPLAISLLLMSGRLTRRAARGLLVVAVAVFSLLDAIYVEGLTIKQLAAIIDALSKQ